MLALVTGFLYGGYVFVYAAVANGGKLAQNPWQALYLDAYTMSSSSPGGNRSTWETILHFGKGLLGETPLGPLVELIP